MGAAGQQVREIEGVGSVPVAGDITFGPWLKARRKTLDLTQRDLAQRVGCTAITIRKFEAGERRPSKQVAERLAVCLEIPPDEQAAFVQFARTTPIRDEIAPVMEPPTPQPAATVILMLAMAPFAALLPRVVQAHYHRGVGSYGAIFSAMAAGMVVGSLLWARWHPARFRVIVCFAAFGINDVGIIALALSPWYPVALAAAAWRGLWIGVGISAWTTLMSELVPERLLSRASSIDFFGSIGLTPVGYVLAGAIATFVAPTTILAIGGALGACLWFAPLTWRRVRLRA